MSHALLLILAVAMVAAAANSQSIKRTNNAGAVRDYLEKIVPVSKDVLLHELMGPKVGADVSKISTSLLNRMMRVVTVVYYSPASSFPQSPILSSQPSQRTGSEMAAASISPGSMSSSCLLAQAKTPNFYEHK
jgi:hypothetical protein